MERKVIFIEKLVVNINMTIFDGEPVAGEGNDALDEFVFEIRGGFEDYDITSLGVAKAVGELVGEEVFVVVKIGFHGGALDFVRLENEEIEKKKDGDSEDNDLENFEKK